MMAIRNEPERIIVTDAETRAALAAVRSLGRAGHQVFTTSTRARALASASRHASQEFVLPDPARDPIAWANALESLAEKLDADWILPITELSLCALYAAGVPSRRPCLCPSRQAYESATDKHAILDVARRAGIRVPRSELVTAPDSLTTLPDGFAYPVVLKARRSRFWAIGRWASGSVTVVNGPAELQRAAQDPGFSGGLLIQEFIPGRGEGIFLLTRGGECLASFAHRRLREKPPSGGISVLRESVAPDPELLKASLALISTIGLDGVSMVEFRGVAGQPPALMEINPRLWGSLQLAIDSGVDFPDLLWRMHSGRPLAPPVIELGVRSRWLLGDLDHLLIALRRREMREATGRSRLEVCLDFLRSFRDGSRLEILRRDDWRPFARELRQWLGG